jgi:hypothetical protein
MNSVKYEIENVGDFMPVQELLPRPTSLLDPTLLIGEFHNSFALMDTLIHFAMLEDYDD